MLRTSEKVVRVFSEPSDKSLHRLKVEDGGSMRTVAVVSYREGRYWLWSALSHRYMLTARLSDALDFVEGEVDGEIH